ncbi:MAG: hypothetical protein R2838_03555 [Caldilineaceae bacterium]
MTTWARQLHIVGQAQVSELELTLERLFEFALRRRALLSAEYQRWNAALAYATIRELCPECDEQQRVLDAMRRARCWVASARGRRRLRRHRSQRGEDPRSGEIEHRFAGRDRILVVKRRDGGCRWRSFPRWRVAGTIIVTSASFKGQDPAAVRREIDAIGMDVPTLSSMTCARPCYCQIAPAPRRRDHSHRLDLHDHRCSTPTRTCST